VAIFDAIAGGTVDLARKAALGQIVHASRRLFLKILGAPLTRQSLSKETETSTKTINQATKGGKNGRKKKDPVGS